jgi:hypothetical protein
MISEHKYYTNILSRGSEIVKIALIEVSMNNKPYNFIIDTGSSLNIVDMNTINEIQKSTEVTPADFRLLEINGGESDSIFTGKVNFKIHDDEYKEDMILADLSQLIVVTKNQLDAKKQ